MRLYMVVVCLLGCSPADTVAPVGDAEQAGDLTMAVGDAEQAREPTLAQFCKDPRAYVGARVRFSREDVRLVSSCTSIGCGNDVGVDDAGNICCGDCTTIWEVCNIHNGTVLTDADGVVKGCSHGGCGDCSGAWLQPEMVGTVRVGSFSEPSASGEQPRVRDIGLALE